MMMIVHGRGWQVSSQSALLQCHSKSFDQIFDGIDFTEVCSSKNEGGEVWIGGHFPTTDLVLLFSARGYAHLFRLPEKYAHLSPSID